MFFSNREIKTKPQEADNVIDLDSRRKAQEERKQQDKLQKEKNEAIQFIRDTGGSFSAEVKGKTLGVEIVNRDMVEEIFTLVEKPALETEAERRKGLVDELQNAANDEEIKAAKVKGQEIVRETSLRIKGYLELYNLFMSMCDGFDTIGANNVTRMLRLKSGGENYLQDWYPTEFRKNDLNQYNNRPDRGLDYYFVLSPANLNKFYDTFKKSRGSTSVVKTGWGFQAEINGIQMAFMSPGERAVKLDAANDDEPQEKSPEEFAA